MWHSFLIFVGITNFIVPYFNADSLPWTTTVIQFNIEWYHNICWWDPLRFRRWDHDQLPREAIPPIGQRNLKLVDVLLKAHHSCRIHVTRVTCGLSTISKHQRTAAFDNSIGKHLSDNDIAHCTG